MGLRIIGEQLTQELQQMGDKFANVQRGVVWNNDDLEFQWTDAKLQERFQFLSRQCNGDEGLFNQAERFLMKNKSHYDRLDLLSNNPYAYVARCNQLRNMIRDCLRLYGNHYFVSNCL